MYFVTNDHIKNLVIFRDKKSINSFLNIFKHGEYLGCRLVGGFAKGK